MPNCPNYPGDCYITVPRESAVIYSEAFRTYALKANKQGFSLPKNAGNEDCFVTNPVSVFKVEIWVLGKAHPRQHFALVRLQILT
ncbi:MAG: hypothetical protein RLZZ338_1501 [Cyanobacteriota bacterium]|jgi:hypothetical protein